MSVPAHLLFSEELACHLASVIRVITLVLALPETSSGFCHMQIPPCLCLQELLCLLTTKSLNLTASLPLFFAFSSVIMEDMTCQPSTVRQVLLLFSFSEAFILQSPFSPVLLIPS